MLLRRDRALLALDIVLDVAFHAGRGDDLAGGADIAERLGAARRGIEPLLQALTRAGLLESLRGPRGGYRLARAARDMTLAEVLAAVVDDPAEAPAPAAEAPLQRAVTAPLWQELDGLLRERLAGVTVDELLRRAAAAGLKRRVSEPLNFAI